MKMDHIAGYWIQQSENKVRRELVWQRADLGRPLINRAQKQEFFTKDPTAAHLTKILAEEKPYLGESYSGSLSWLAQHWHLTPVECWMIGLSLFSFIEGGAGSLFAEILGRKGHLNPSLQLAQLLWDQPQEVLIFLDPAQRLLQSGLICVQGSGWESTLSICPNVARSLLAIEPIVPLNLRFLEKDEDLPESIHAMAGIVCTKIDQAWSQEEFPWVKVGSLRNERTAELALAVSEKTGRPLFEFLGKPEELPSVVTWSWLQGASLVTDKIPDVDLPPLPVMKFAPGDRVKDAETYVLPESTVPQRVNWFKKNLGEALSTFFTEQIQECARRYRFGPQSVRSACLIAVSSSESRTSEVLRRACLAESRSHFGTLAQAVTLKFQESDLVLPTTSHQHFEEICQVVKNTLTRSAYLENTGFTLMFSGPPGTGKTMAAEVLALRTGLPMYRIDLSQVVNKYIGETEKNLGSVFDAAEEGECLLFFDEADALFGRRTEVRDAHDRYANLEISYLLQRMEGFRGVVVLATNRKRDLDEAFLRRIRYSLDFTLPDQRERKKLWETLLPLEVDRSDLDIEFLAKHFLLTGGYIRSAIQNAYSLKCMSSDTTPRLEQLDVLIAIHRELEKQGRSTTADQFGPYTKAVLDRIRGSESKGEPR